MMTLKAQKPVEKAERVTEKTKKIRRAGTRKGQRANHLRVRERDQGRKIQTKKNIQN